MQRSLTSKYIKMIVPSLLLCLPLASWASATNLNLEPPPPTQQSDAQSSVQLQNEIQTQLEKHALFHPWWINIGLGIGALEDSSGYLGGDVSLDYAVTQHQLLTVRTAGINNTKGIHGDNIAYATSGGLIHASDHVGGIGDIGAMYGLMSRHNWGYVSASAGLAVVDGSSSPTGYFRSTGKDFTTVGIPLEVQTFWTPTKHVGVGLIGFADANLDGSFAGVTLALQFGQLKDS